MRQSRANGMFKDVPDAQWNDWHWQVENRIETLEDLKKHMTLTPEEEEGIKATLGKLRMAITPYYLSLIDLDNPHDPIRKQAIPTDAELHFAPYEDADPLHEDIDSPCPGLTHRYPDRVLLLITDQCSMYCVTAPAGVSPASMTAPCRSPRSTPASTMCATIPKCATFCFPAATA